MADRRRVTEEDAHVTEALIADSFGRLKKSIAEAPHEAVRPAANLIREHPFVAAAAAAGAGMVAFQVFRMVAPGPTPKEQKKRSRGLLADVIGHVLPMAAPYIASMLQQQVGKALTGERR